MTDYHFVFHWVHNFRLVTHAHDSWLFFADSFTFQCCCVAMSLLRLVGFSDWNSDVMTIFIEDSVMANERLFQRVQTAVGEHLVTLFLHLFLSSKPSRPSQSRWTGVASVAQFTLSLALCHRLLQPLFAGLTSKDEKDPSKTAAAVADLDVRALDYFQWVIQQQYFLTD